MHNNSGEHAMAEFGDIFDYQICTTVFSYITIFFVAAYGLLGVWMTGRQKADAVGTLRPVRQSPNQ
jgi:hypothetical protein